MNTQTGRVKRNIVFTCSIRENEKLQVKHSEMNLWKCYIFFMCTPFLLDFLHKSTKSLFDGRTCHFALCVTTSFVAIEYLLSTKTDDM